LEAKLKNTGIPQGSNAYTREARKPPTYTSTPRHWLPVLLILNLEK